VQVDKARDEYDTAARLSAVFAIGSPVSGLLLIWNGGWWRLMPIALVVLSYVGYRSACAAARYYGVTLNTAFDLHRFDLMDRLAISIEETGSLQRIQNETLSEFLAEDATELVFPFTFTKGVRREPQ
jgi:hypothetical protein